MAPDVMRAAVSATSDASASNLRTKYANASSALLPGYEPTAFSPADVRTYTVPSSATRPNCEGSPMSADAALTCGMTWDGSGLCSLMRFPFSASAVMPSLMQVMVGGQRYPVLLPPQKLSVRIPSSGVRDANSSPSRPDVCDELLDCGGRKRF